MTENEGLFLHQLSTVDFTLNKIVYFTNTEYVY